jgi:N-acetyl sugar amidotransferase
MDTTDPDIQFDSNGICNHCYRYEEKMRGRVFVDKSNQQKFSALIEKIKEEGKNKQYDCIIGVSGGVDSTYVAYLVKNKWKLRPLAIHLDNGWNSELAVSNIEKTLKALDIDLYTYVLDWEEFKDLQLSFLYASVPDLEVPTDHVIYALLNKMAIKWGIPYIFTGVNVRTEGVHPLKWSYGLWDWKYIKSVHRIFGKKQLKSYLHCNMVEILYFSLIKKIKRIPLLNYIDYAKKEAVEILEKEIGWRYYGGKHYESIYTRFVQGYILPTKFNIDKRRAHLSSLILSGETTREEALNQIKNDTYPSREMLQEDKAFALKKLELSLEDFEKIMALPKKTVENYSSNFQLFLFLRKLSSRLKIFKYV